MLTGMARGRSATLPVFHCGTPVQAVAGRFAICRKCGRTLVLIRGPDGTITSTKPMFDDETDTKPTGGHDHDGSINFAAK